MSRLRRSLPESEDILFEAKRHWVRYAAPVAIGIVGLALIFAVPAMQSWLPIDRSYIAWLIPGGSVLFALFWYYARKGFDEFHEMAVTDTNIISTEGIGKSKLKSLRLEKVEFVEVEQSLLGRILGYGDIVILSQGKTSAGSEQVKKPIEFRNRVISERDRAVKREAHLEPPYQPKSVSTQ